MPTPPGHLGHEDDDAEVIQVVGNSKTNKVASVKLTVVRDQRPSTIARRRRSIMALKLNNARPKDELRAMTN